jgi:hypothetical protein
LKQHAADALTSATGAVNGGTLMVRTAANALTKTDVSRRLGKPLSARQLAAVDLLAAGQTGQAAADALGTTRQTLHTWRTDPRFAAALNERRQDLWDTAIARVRSLVPEAIEVLAEAVTEGRDVKAAAKVIELSGFAKDGLPRPGPTDPASVLDAALQARAFEAEAALFAGIGVGGVTDADRLAALGEVLVDDDGGDDDQV